MYEEVENKMRISYNGVCGFRKTEDEMSRYTRARVFD